MIITISGLAGSGKSTVAQKLEQILHWKRIYVGGIRRELAKKKGITLEELNQYAQTHPETDVDVDTKAAAEAIALEKKGKNVIVEGRTQFHFLPQSFKVYIKVSPAEAARRIWKDLQDKQKKKQRNEGEYKSLATLKKFIIARNENDARRYQKYYGFDHRDESQYDLIIDSTTISADEVVKKILEYMKKKRLQ
ncbi:MAG: AAA family ATPase [Nanoarchaeota archaeon]|nr:AAA family ATPase [Nanoarchaeota archaeon]